MAEIGEKYYVEVVKIDGGEVVKRLGPAEKRRAEKIEDGLMWNMNHDGYFTRMVRAELVSAASIESR